MKKYNSLCYSEGQSRIKSITIGGFMMVALIASCIIILTNSLDNKQHEAFSFPIIMLFFQLFYVAKHHKFVIEKIIEVLKCIKTTTLATVDHNDNDFENQCNDYGIYVGGLSKALVDNSKVINYLEPGQVKMSCNAEASKITASMETNDIKLSTESAFLKGSLSTSQADLKLTAIKFITLESGAQKGENSVKYVAYDKENDFAINKPLSVEDIEMDSENTQNPVTKQHKSSSVQHNDNLNCVSSEEDIINIFTDVDNELPNVAKEARRKRYESEPAKKNNDLESDAFTLPKITSQSETHDRSLMYDLESYVKTIHGIPCDNGANLYGMTNIVID